MTNEIGLITSFGYDPVGATSLRTFPSGAVTIYSTDPLGWIRSRAYGDGTFAPFSYDQVGNRVRMEDVTGVTTFGYDTVDKLAGRTDPGPLVQAYAFDRAGNRIRLVEPGGGTRTFVYDVENRVSTYRAPTGNVLSMGYSAAGQLTTQIFPDGMRIRTSFDAVGQIVSILADSGAGSALLSRQDYAYDGDGNRTVVNDLVLASLTTYSYDPKSRLVKDETSGANAHIYNYIYDAIDNRLSDTENGTLRQWLFDAVGRITTMSFGNSLTTYTYTLDGWMKSVIGSAIQVTMQYGPEGEMIAHQDGLSLATYAYDGDRCLKLQVVDGLKSTFV